MNETSRRGAWIPWIFIIGMGVVVVVNGGLVFFSQSTWSGLVTENYYDKGIKYNENLEGARRQARLGWRVRATLSPGSEGGAEIGALYRNRDGTPIEGLSVRAYLIRPVSEGNDVEAVLGDKGLGRYSVVIETPLPGQWDLRLVANDKEGNVHQSVERVMVRQ